MSVRAQVSPSLRSKVIWQSFGAAVRPKAPGALFEWWPKAQGGASQPSRKGSSCLEQFGCGSYKVFRSAFRAAKKNHWEPRRQLQQLVPLSHSCVCGPSQQTATFVLGHSPVDWSPAANCAGLLAVVTCEMVVLCQKQGA